MYCSGENICSSCWPSWNSPTTPRDLDVGEHFFQVADTGGELLHLAKALLDFAQVGGDLAEGFGEAVFRVACSFSSTVTRICSSLAALSSLSLVRRSSTAKRSFSCWVVRFTGELVEAAVEGFAGFELVAVDLGDEVGEALRDGVEVLLDGGAEDLVGGLVVGAEAVEAGVEEVAELGDVVGDLAAEVGEGGGCGLPGAAGLGGVVGAELGELVTEMVVERLGAGVEPDELRGERVGELDEAGILLGCRGFAHEKEDDRDE